ncbi:MarR family winged helix-turn-helix transcriptional regulator [Actinomycetospora corticicola]|uniref:DNA-binding MarR family transcriptional regulator n=1 Tax=Actinomycetospora corticicola TaxID=663602 RepID=A0A7Y9J8H9_9PSEU|nr:MarR family winged helix-turn-helix transcriptional regulator [Actinomycetospora corticicola]NYD39445.1 DNA-binding MarR family transcriptional regulator [Actinomycetospora corticicola]
MSPPERAAAEAMARDLVAGCVGLRVDRLHRAVARIHEGALARIGLSLAQTEILGIVVGHGRPLPPSAVASALTMERSTVSRTLAGMTTAGWIEAVELTPTGRTRLVGVTPLGLQVLASARGAWEGAQTRVLERLGPEALDVLDRWLAALVDPMPP